MLGQKDRSQLVPVGHIASKVHKGQPNEDIQVIADV